MLKQADSSRVWCGKCLGLIVMLLLALNGVVDGLIWDRDLRIGQYWCAASLGASGTRCPIVVWLLVHRSRGCHLRI
jgi:hypothetical protein